jgi:leucine-zipper-like transcriptional regulator 1
MKPILKRTPLWLLLGLFPLLAGCPSNTPTSPGSGVWEEMTSNAFSGGRYGLAGTVFNNQMWAVGGAAYNGSATVYYGDVYSSSSGSSWTKVNAGAPFGGRYGSQLLSFNGGLWLIGGNNNGTLRNDVWNSTDGNGWTRVLASTPAGTATQFSPREDFGALVYNGSMWVIGGWDGKNENDVWSSTDGITWTDVSPAKKCSCKFAARWGLSTAVFNNQMWVFAGASSNTATENPDTLYGDAWNSAGGAAWTEAATYGGYGLLCYTQVVPLGSLLRLTGGYYIYGGRNETASSPDGIQWTQANAAFPPRFYHLSLAYDNYVWVIGGADDYCDQANGCPVSYLNDVWRAQ